MEDVIEITVSEKETDNLIAHLYTSENEQYVISNRKFKVNIIRKNSPFGEDEFNT